MGKLARGFCATASGARSDEAGALDLLGIGLAVSAIPFFGGECTLSVNPTHVNVITDALGRRNPSVLLNVHAPRLTQAAAPTGALPIAWCADSRLVWRSNQATAVAAGSNAYACPGVRRCSRPHSFGLHPGAQLHDGNCRMPGGRCRLASRYATCRRKERKLQLNPISRLSDRSRRGSRPSDQAST